MTTADKINLASLGVAILGILMGVIGGLINTFVGSLAAVAICVLSWMVWVTARLVLARPAEKHPKTILLSSHSLPYTAFYSSLQDQIVSADSEYKKVKIPAVFLTWPRFTLLFWAEITEEFFKTHRNRYLFCYTTNTSDASGHPNAFYLRLVGKSTTWQFVIKGSDSSKQTRFTFSSSQNLLGWKLFCVRWNKNEQKVDFSIDAGHVFQDSKAIPDGFWPENDSNWQFHLGGWQDNWPGGISELRFYNFRVF